MSTLQGQLDSADRHLIRGWARDAWLPERKVSLLVTANDVLIGRVIANRYRADLAEAGLGDGRHAFELRIENGLPPLSSHRIRILREPDGAELDRSPWLIDAADALDDTVFERLSVLFADRAHGDREALDRCIGFLLGELDRLLGARDAGAAGATAWRAARAGAAVGTRMLDMHALVIDEVLPDARRDAGSNALLSHIAALQRLGFSVSFAAADLAGSAPDKRAVGCLAAMGVAVHATPFVASIEEILRRHGSSLSLVYLHRASVASRYARLVRRHAPSARLLCLLADLQHLRLARQAAAEGRPELLPIAARSRVETLDAAAAVDTLVTHSTHEAALLRRALPRACLHVVPWAVTARPAATPWERRNGVAFLADYAHAPNLDAARRLIREIMPLVWQHAPTMRCLLAGSRMPPDLVGDDLRLVPVGHVPELARLWERVRLTVAPLAYGAGIKGKVMESLAAGIPCAMTPVAAEGLELPAALDEFTAADTHGLAGAILSLHGDAATNARAAEAGLVWARERLSESAIDAALAGAVCLDGTPDMFPVSLRSANVGTR